MKLLPDKLAAWVSSRFAAKSGSTMDLLRYALYGMSSSSGKVVNNNTALQVSAVYACLRVVGEGVAQVPLQLMLESADGKTRTKAKSHRLYNLLAFKPNDWQTSFEFREMLVWHVMLCGAHFSFINRNSRGEILELIPFTPGQVTVQRQPDYTITYKVRAENGSERVFPAETIWHVKGPSWDSWQGLEAVKLARDAIGLAMATEEAVASLHKNGVRASGTYSVEGTLKQDQYDSLATWVKDHYSGADKAGLPMIMDRGAKWISSQMTGIDAQTLENRKFQIAEVCRYFRVNPIMVYGDDKAATYAGSTANFLSHLVHTISPWFQRLEQSMDANLLSDKERTQGYYFNFVEEGLLRGSALETKEILLGYLNGGAMTANEIRAKLDLNPDTDPASDKLRIPANIVGAVPPADNVPTDPPPTDPTPDPAATKMLDDSIPNRVGHIESAG